MAHDEFSLIRNWTSRSAGQEGDGLTIGIGDDAAVFAVSDGMEVVACCDAMIETVHFLRKTMNSADIGYKAMISNISDIAAMGGIPRFALVSIGISASWSPEDCNEIYDGIYQAAEEYGVRVIGGDTVSTPDALHLSITLIGEVEAGRALRRSAAKAGDIVFVTGPLGGSAAGLHLLLEKQEASMKQQGNGQYLMKQHQRPTAQVAAGRLLLKSGVAGALNDISDGLASELWEIAEASAVSIMIDRTQVPIAKEVSNYATLAGLDPLEWAFFGGEDYQLVGTVADESFEILTERFADAGHTITMIGRVEQGEPSVWLQDGEKGRSRLIKAGYNHFKQE